MTPVKPVVAKKKDGEEQEDKVAVKDLLTQVLKEIRNGELLAAFTTHRGPDLASQTGDKDQPTGLHIMANEDKNLLPNLEEKMELFVKFLCQQKNYLEIKDCLGHTPLFLAIEQRNKTMVQWMCHAHPDTSNIISIVGSKGMNCLHIGINKRIKFLDLLIDKVKHETLAAKDDNWNTPLHVAVGYENCKREQLEYVKMILEKGDRAIFDSPKGRERKSLVKIQNLPQVEASRHLCRLSFQPTVRCNRRCETTYKSIIEQNMEAAFPSRLLVPSPHQSRLLLQMLQTLRRKQLASLALSSPRARRVAASQVQWMRLL
jgi:hypothetical protein